MRNKDKHKPETAKAVKTINFDIIVLRKLEERANQEQTTVSKIVNLLCRKVILSDVKYYETLAKHHYLKFQEAKFLKEQAEAIKEGE